jgi:pimeloyl-ACP methyl ester carboxylesterase
MILTTNTSASARHAAWAGRTILAGAALWLADPTAFAAAQPASSPEAAGVEAAQIPELQWAPCADADGSQTEAGFECATARVPLDYANPRDRTIDLALIRLPASSLGQRIGSLFVNPGGPGSSGVDHVRFFAQTTFPSAVRERFDIVGFDPRFVGKSQETTCLRDDEWYTVLGGLPSMPLTPEEQSRVMDAHARYAALCAERAPDIQYAATANVARDLELLRRAVGDDKLNYAGYSYGSVLGQTYAALYPNNVRALLIDGIADAQAWSGTPEQASIPMWVRIGNAQGAWETLQEFFRRCAEVGPERCSFAAYGDPATTFARLADEMRTRSIMEDNPDFKYASLITDITVAFLPTTESWHDLSYLLTLYWNMAFPPQGEVTAQEAAAARIEELTARARERMQEEPWLWEGFPGANMQQDPTWDPDASTHAVRCADTIAPSSLEEWSTAAAAEEQRWPYFGTLYAFDAITCAAWQLPAPGRYSGPYNLPTSAPVLVASTRFDVLTPLQNAQTVANRIPGARLIVVDGVAHTTSNVTSACMDAVVSDYFVDGVLPPSGMTCPSEETYFPAPRPSEPEIDEQL